ncbi:MAG: FtsX-like permease family protein, partial [Anaeroplasmataceae bacterium]|nr:FtsX-like permease family protein [Anaeroplasmataceae bacterium]
LPSSPTLLSNPTFKNARFTLKEIFHIAIQLDSRLFHFLLNIFLLIFSITFLIIAVSLSFYNEKKALLNTMYKNQQEIASFEVTPLSQKKSTTAHPISPYAKAIPISTLNQIEKQNVGSILKVKSQNLYYNFCSIDFEKKNISSYFEGYTKYNEIPKEFNFQLLFGNLPKNKNEIALPLLVCQNLIQEAKNLNIKELSSCEDVMKYPLHFSDDIYSVCGIYSLETPNFTRYFENKKSTDEIKQEKDTLLQSASATILVHEDFIYTENIYYVPLSYKSTIQNQIYKAAPSFLYTDEQMPLSSIHQNIDWFSQEQEVLQQNEIILPSSLAKKYEVEDLKNLEIDQLYFGNRSVPNPLLNAYPIKVVGVYQADDSTTIVSKEIANILSDIYAYDGFPSIAIKLSGNLKQDLKLLNQMQEFDLTISNNVSLMINRIHEPLSIIKMISIILSILLFVLLLFMLIQYATQILQKNRKKIGILRMQGIKVNQLTLPFLLHYLGIMVISCSFSILFAFLGFQILFQWIQYFSSTQINFSNSYGLSFGIVIPIIFILVLLLSYLLYYIKIRNQNPIALVKEQSL